MAKPKIEDPLIQRSRALQGQADDLTPLVDRNMRRLANLEPDLARMRGSLSLDVATATKGNARSTGDSLQAGLLRARTLTTAAAQGEGQLRQANLQQRMSLGNKAIRGQAVANEQLSANVQRQQAFKDASMQAASIRSNARNGMFGTLAGAGIAFGTSPAGQDFFGGLKDRFNASQVMKNPILRGADGIGGFNLLPTDMGSARMMTG